MYIKIIRKKSDQGQWKKQKIIKESSDFLNQNKQFQ